MLGLWAAVPTVVAVLMLGAAGPAWAGGDIWGWLDCDQDSFAGCELGTGRTASPNGDAGLGSQPSPATSSAAPRRAGCRVVPLEDHSRSDIPGAWVVSRCPDYTLYRGPGGLPLGAASRGSSGGGAAPVTVPQLAVAAYRQLRLPSPVLGASPPGPQLVNLPVWLWLDPPSWTPQSATVAVPGVRVTARATPTRVVWSLGDGTWLTCHSAGTPFVAGADPAAASPDCGHTYRSSSASRPGGAVVVRATVFWTVAWSGAGQQGRFEDLATTAETAWAVRESPGVNTG